MNNLIKNEKNAEYMTVKQIAELCNVSFQTIHNWIDKIPSNFLKVENGVESKFCLREVILILKSGGVSEYLIALLINNSNQTLIQNEILELKNDISEIKTIIKTGNFQIKQVREDITWNEILETLNKNSKTVERLVWKIAGESILKSKMLDSIKGKLIYFTFEEVYKILKKGNISDRIIEIFKFK
jgi:hypothetical protein